MKITTEREGGFHSHLAGSGNLFNKTNRIGGTCLLKKCLPIRFPWKYPNSSGRQQYRSSIFSRIYPKYGMEYFKARSGHCRRM